MKNFFGILLFVTAAPTFLLAAVNDVKVLKRGVGPGSVYMYIDPIGGSSFYIDKERFGIAACNKIDIKDMQEKYQRARSEGLVIDLSKVLRPFCNDYLFEVRQPTEKEYELMIQGYKARLAELVGENSRLRIKILKEQSMTFPSTGLLDEATGLIASNVSWKPLVECTNKIWQENIMLKKLDKSR